MFWFVVKADARYTLRKIVVNYVRKLGNIADFKEMKISLKQHKHGKTFKHEINALAIFSEGKFDSSVTEWNLYSALSSVCEKILNEVNHSKNRV